MKLFELHLNESVTLSVAKLAADGSFSDEELGKEIEGTCDGCEGSGKDWQDEDLPCDWCKGTGKMKKYEMPFDELNMANSAAEDFLSGIGINPRSNGELAGHLDPQDLPALRRKLIKIKNGGVDSLTTPDDVSGGEMKVTRDKNNIPKIERTAKVFTSGRSEEQINRYIDELLKLIDFAQKNGGTITWS
jgi:RecJ-like exonuclease